MVAAGDAPDLAQIGAYADYAAKGELYQADELLSIPTQADFVGHLADAGKVSRTQYGMPFAASTRLLFFNKKLFTEAGLTPPTTWSELAADAAALKEEGVKYPYALPLGPEEAQAEAMQWLLSGGDGYTSEVGTYGIDSPQNIRTFTWLKDELVDKGLTGPVAPGRLNRAAAFAAFARGEVGMLNGHPSLMKTAVAKGVDVGMVPMPGEKSSTRSAMGVADWMMAFRKNGHRSEAGEFLDFVYDEKNVLAFSREYDLLPVTSSASRTMSTAARDKDLAPSWRNSRPPSSTRSARRPGRRSVPTSSSGSVRRSRRTATRRRSSPRCRSRPTRRRTPSRPEPGRHRLRGHPPRHPEGRRPLLCRWRGLRFPSWTDSSWGDGNRTFSRWSAGGSRGRVRRNGRSVRSWGWRRCATTSCSTRCWTTSGRWRATR